MTTITHYAISDESGDPGRAIGVFRRVKTENSQVDEVFSRNLRWEFSPLLYSAERGDTTYEFTEITEAEAERIVERITADADDQK